MNVLKMLAANAPATGNQTLYQIIDGLGLTTNLKLCLDSGDSASYDPAVQTDKWLDTSGNGFDFFRGTGTGSDAADPTFNGTAGGLSSSEYFSYDGGDFFNYDTTNETWMNNLHKNNAIFSIFSVVYRPGGNTNNILLTTRANSTTSVGIDLYLFATNVIRLRQGNGTTIQTVNSGGVLPTSSFVSVGFSYNEATPILRRNINGTSSSATPSYTSPSASNAGATTCIGALGGSIPSNNGNYISCIAVWEGTALTAQNLTDLYDGIKGRFGL
jgi:hypothetical protein